MPIPLKASFWFVVCSVFQKGISFFTTPIFTRLLSTEQFGQVTLFVSWSSIVCIFTTLNLQYGSFNTAQVKFRDDRDRYLSSLQGIVTLLTLIALVIFLLNPSFWGNLFELPTYIVAIMLVDIWATFAIGLWMGNKRFDYDYKPMVAITLFTSIMSPLIGILVVPMFIERGAIRIITIVALNVVVGFTIYVFNLIKGKTLFVKKYWKYALGFNIPLIPYYLSQTIFNMSDRIMISKMVGNDKAGIYGLAYASATVLAFVISAIGDSYTPWYYRKIKENDSSGVRTINKKLMVFVTGMMVFIIIIGPEIVFLMGGQPYMESIWIIPPVAGSMVFLYLVRFAINIEFYYEKKWMMVGGTALSAIINIAMNYICIPKFGYIAAGYTTLLSYIVFWLVNNLSAHKICKDNGLSVVDYLDFRFEMIIGIVFMVLMVGLTFSYYNTVIRYILFAIICIMILIYRKKIFSIVTEFRDLKQK